jgi:purine-binding chemotaxis protein CheW
MNALVATGSAARSFYTFRLGQRLHGINVLHVREISPHLPMMPVPQAPPAVRGLVNLRSRIYLVLDLRPLMGMAAIPCTAESRLIILKSEIGQDVGILVEHGSDIAHVSTDQIEPFAGAGDAAGEGASSLVVGVCKLESELMILVDPVRIIEAVTALFDKASR